MNDSKYILDFESLVGRDGECIVKELSFVSSTEPYRFGRTVLFKPPYAGDLVPSKNQCANRWLTYQRHGIKWDDGITPYENLHHIVQGLHGDIFVRGREKAKFIAGIVGRPVFELEVLGCPKVEQLRVAHMCPLRHHRGSSLCSEYKCRAYAMWFEENLRTISLEAAYDAKVGNYRQCPPDVARTSDCFEDASWDD